MRLSVTTTLYSIAMIGTALVHGGSAFVLPSPQPRPLLSPVVASTAGDPLSDIDEMCLENMAQLCADNDNAVDSQCDVDDYEALVNRLEDQRRYHAEHVAHLDQVLEELTSQGGPPRSEHDVDQLRASIQRALHMEETLIHRWKKESKQANGLSI